MAACTATVDTIQPITCRGLSDHLKRRQPASGTLFSASRRQLTPRSEPVARSAVGLHITCAVQRLDSPSTSGVAPTEWFQKTIALPAYRRGCHVVTRKILEQLPELADFEVGMANLFIQHTSASLTINENASPDVPLDLNDSLDRIAPEGHHYRHLDEGLDDMPAHVKSSLMGASLSLPVRQGGFALGTWQGIYLNEHRNYGGSRSLVITIQGQKRSDGRAYGRSYREQRF
ncbi:hypothetical protein WJX72_012275 [[Myrmecia] bisecta]|uniref:Secondary thiamine-phosphate synthase enzyme n=1 Tax=[Myrmecia] bisecta TaxID=41462 RepID=A0AAW1QT78_9CHLO